MLDLAKITNPTGRTYMPGPGNYTTNLNNYQFPSDETGKDSRCIIQKGAGYIQDSFPYRLLATTTGADTYECQELLIIIGTKIVSHNSITNASFVINHPITLIRKGKKVLQSVALHSPQELKPSRNQHEITDLATSLRELSGLDVESLAQIFQVSRITYHRWLKGLPLTKRHRDYVLEIHPLLEEAAQRLGSPEAVSTWLLTPVSAGGKKPIEYLANKRYELFRGFLLHQPTGKEIFRPLKPSNRQFKPRTREETEDVREQLRPHTWYDEDGELDSKHK